MEVVILNDALQVADKGAELVASLLKVDRTAVLGLATGSTPIELYARLRKSCSKGEISFAGATAFNLDEYLGIDEYDPQSYRSFMNRVLFDHIDIDKRRTHLPACERGQNPRHVGPDYEARIRASGGIDLQVLGIGRNGHIGFNEPGSSLGSRTRVKTLTRKTMKDNSRLFRNDETQPKLAITMGIRTIMDARRVLMLATGSMKAQAVAQMIEGPVSAFCPASALQFHERVTVLLDRSAATQLKNTEYYLWASEQNEALTDRFGAE